MAWPKAPQGTHEVQHGTTTLDVDDNNVIVSRVETDGAGNITSQTRDGVRWINGETE